MSVLLTCPQGHQWQSPFDPAPPSVLVCPICGLGANQTGSDASTLRFPGPTGVADQPTLVPPDPFASTRDLAERPGGRPKANPFERLKIPGYEVLEELGRGGMGVVYKARQVKLNRIVALKMILSGAHAGAVESMRFRAEAEAIAHLQHPNIVQIHEVNEHEGVDFLSLEYVDGGVLAQKLAGKPQPPRLAARLLMSVARAVHAAHQAGIVHRDLKPGNILLARFCPEMFDQSSDKTESIDAARLYGTPKITDFGLAKNLDPASSGSNAPASVTGAVLGTPSYMAPEQAIGSKNIGPATDVYALGAILYEMLTGRPPFQASTALEIVCQVVSDEPVRPTYLAPKSPRDLETICLKCLRKEPNKRYGSAAELADDLHRFLDGEPIRARPTPWWERTWKWVRRHPTGAGLIGVTSLAALVLVLGGAITNVRLQRALDSAEAKGEATRQTMVRLHVANGVHRMDEGDGFGALVWFTEALRLDEGRPERENAHRLRIAAVLRQCPKLIELWTHKGAVRSVQISSDGKSVLSAGDDGARLWTFESSGRGLHLDAGSLLRAVFSPDGRRVATASLAGAARVWQRSNGKALTPNLNHPGLRAVAFDNKGILLATAGSDGVVRLWTASSGVLVVSLKHPPAVVDLAFSPDGRLLVSSGANGVVRLWNTDRWSALPMTFAHPGEAVKVAFSPDGRRLVTAGSKGTARVWKVSTGLAVGPPLRHEQAINHASFSPDGRRLVTASEDGTARIWRLPEGELQGEMLKHKSSVLHAEFSPDGCRVATASDDNSARVWNAITGRPVSPPLRHNGTVNQVAWSPDGRRVVAGADDGVVRVWGPPAEARGTRVSRKGEQHRLSLPIELGAPEVSAAEKPGSTREPGKRSSIATSPDGRSELRLGTEYSVQIHDARTGEQVGSSLMGHSAAIMHASFSPDGQRIITASADQTARVWDVHSGDPICRPLTHASRVIYATFSPSGKRVLTTAEDNSARIWDAGSGEMLLPPFHHNGTVVYGAFSSDGLRLATVCKDRTVRVWDSRSGESLAPVMQHASAVRQVAFSSDDLRLITTRPDGARTTWDLSGDDRSGEDLQALAGLLASQRIDRRGGALPMGPEQLDTAWSALKARYPESFRSSADEVEAWHRGCSEEYLSVKQWGAAVWHLDRLLASKARDSLLLAQRGLAFAEQQLWREADADLARSVASGAPEVEVWCLHALLRLHEGDRKSYRKVCETLLERAGLGANLRTGYVSAWACVLASDSVKDRAKVVQMMETVAAGARNADTLTLLGLAYLRAGQLDKSLLRLNEAKSLREGPAVVEWLALAATHQQLGQTVEARMWLNRAVQWLAESEKGLAWPKRLQVGLLRREVSEALRERQEVSGIERFPSEKFTLAERKSSLHDVRCNQSKYGAWPMSKVTRDTVCHALRECAAEHHIALDTLEIVLSNLAPAVCLVAGEGSKSAIGATRAGGQPDLPSGTAWPRTAEAREPMPFILQVNLGEIARFAVDPLLPSFGLMSFFFYTQDEDSGEEGRVLYFPEPLSGLARQRFPRDLPAETRYRAVPLESCFEWTLPSRHDIEFDNFEHFWELLRVAGAAQGRLPERGDSFQLLGNPHFVQEGRLGQGERLLLQVNADYGGGEDERETGMSWGDGGQVYFVISDGDLKSHNFERVEVMLDMC